MLFGSKYKVFFFFFFFFSCCFFFCFVLYCLFFSALRLDLNAQIILWRLSCFDTISYIYMLEEGA